MWIAKQREGHVYVGGVQATLVQSLIAHLQKKGVPSPSIVCPETRSVTDTSEDAKGPQGLQFDGVKVEEIQPHLNTFGH